jgi:hypothetical protein
MFRKEMKKLKADHEVTGKKRNGTAIIAADCIRHARSSKVA